MTPPNLGVFSDEEISRQAWGLLGELYDPELGVDLVNLGLIYDLTVCAGAIAVQMSLTTPGCPLSDTMPEAVTRALETIPGVAKVEVDLVWEPRWEPELMSDQAKRELGWL